MCGVFLLLFLLPLIWVRRETLFGLMQVEVVFFYFCTHKGTHVQTVTTTQLVLPLQDHTHTLHLRMQQMGKTSVVCVAAACKHGSFLLPNGWCLSLPLSLKHTLRESVKIPIIHLAFFPSMSDAIIKSGAKFELVSRCAAHQQSSFPPVSVFLLSGCACAPSKA